MLEWPQGYHNILAKTMIVTRFAPSPTGDLHVGSVRTALYSFLFAKKQADQGRYLLRIEDTDALRSTKASTQGIEEGLAWLGLLPDEPPVHQSDRLSRYHEVIEVLLASDQAYRCTCTPERLDRLRAKQTASGLKPKYDGHCRHAQLTAEAGTHVVRLAMPQEGAIVVLDRVHGNVRFACQELDDWIILRSDGMPTYNLAVVVDDHDMEVTHVIRGDDHLNNTPKQQQVCQALSWEPPVWAHLPMIHGPDGKKLSKRHGAVHVLSFKKEGYLPHAVLNYLVRLGWSHGDQEIFSLEEMIAAFDFGHVQRASARFDWDKLRWLNQHYLKTLPASEVAPVLEEQFRLREWPTPNTWMLETLVSVFKDRCHTLSEMAEKSRFVVMTPEYDPLAVAQHLGKEKCSLLLRFAQVVSALEIWEAEPLQDALKSFVKEQRLSLPEVAQPLRVVLTGSTQAPAIGITLALLGKTEVLARIKAQCVDREEAEG